MARGYGTYSRVVAWLKILLPLLALGVLATVFLITPDRGFDSGFTFSQADIDTLEAGSYLTAPQINGITDKGEPFFLVASRIEAVEGSQNLVRVTNLQGRFEFLSGAWVRLEADSALADTTSQTLTLETGGTLITSDGNAAEVESLSVQLATGEMQGVGIVADGPLGHISADQFRIEANELENRVLWFENNVKVTYMLAEEGR